MKVLNAREPLILFIFDALVFWSSLWLALTLRHFEFPSLEFLSLHLKPFFILFVIWILIFYIAGLYDKHTKIVKGNLPSILLHTQIVAGIIALTCFYFFVSFFLITPKTILILFVAISFLLFYVIRVVIFPKISLVKKQRALVIGNSDILEKLGKEINAHNYYPFYFVAKIDPNSIDSTEEFKKKCLEIINNENIELIIDDISNNKLSDFFYELVLQNIYFIKATQLYEYVFQKISLQLISHDWFIRYLSQKNKIFFDVFKRIMDIMISIFGLICTIILFPFIAIAIKIGDPTGTIFISQKRLSRNKKMITIYKFRTMIHNENGVWIGESKNKITRVGKILRKSSIDELPQFWNILKGDMSLVGPRPDITGLSERLASEIPYYSARYVIKPGLSGWAQIQQKIVPNNIEDNKDRLAYDLYYIKNRSILLDIKIILKTIKALIMRRMI